MMHYAQINETGTVIAVTQVAGEIISANMVPIVDFDTALIGCTYAGGAFTKPAPVAQKFITVGAFFDRFGAHKWPILADTNPVVHALIKDCSVRKHINLDEPQLPAGLGLLVEAGHAIDVQAILSAPVQPNEAP